MAHSKPYYVDGVQECIVVSFGGNAHVDKQTPGSRRHEVNSLRMFEFGKRLIQSMISLLSKYNINITDL